MTEFLSNLVSRSMSRGENAQSAPVLRPRLPSLFEAPTGEEGAAISAVGSQTSPHESEAAPWSLEISSRQDAPSDAVSRADPLPPAARRETPAHRRLRTERNPSSESEEAEQAESSVRPRRSPAGIHRPLQPAEDNAQVHPFSATVTTGVLGSALPERGSIQGEEQIHREVLRDTTLTVSPLRARSQEMLADLPARGIEPSGTNENERPGTGWAAGQYTQSTEKVSVPTVHISIGRIEVRAVTQPAPQPAPRPVRQQPRLGLDDYLRQRSEGKR